MTSPGFTGPLKLTDGSDDGQVVGTASPVRFANVSWPVLGVAMSSTRTSTPCCGIGAFRMSAPMIAVFPETARQVTGPVNGPNVTVPVGFSPEAPLVAEID